MRIWALVILVLASARFGGVDAPDLTEALSAWEQAASQLANVSAEFIVYEKSSAGGEYAPSEIGWKRRGRHKLLRAEKSRSGRWSGEVICENEDYSFRLVRQDRTQAWRLTELVVASESGQSPYIQLMLDVNGVGLGLLPLSVGAVNALELFTSSAVKVDSVTETPDGMMLIEFHVPERKKALAKEVGFRYSKGSLTVDPRHAFSVVGHELSRPEGGHILGGFVPSAQGPGDAGELAVFGTWTSVYRKADGSEREQGRMEVKAFDVDCRVPYEEFRLTAFGLPEPAGIAKARSRQFSWWLGLAGLVIAAVGVWVFVRAAPKRR